MTSFFRYFRFKSCQYLNDFLSFFYLLRIQRIKDIRLIKRVILFFYLLSFTCINYMRLHVSTSKRFQ